MKLSMKEYSVYNKFIAKILFAYLIFSKFFFVFFSSSQIGLVSHASFCVYIFYRFFSCTTYRIFLSYRMNIRHKTTGMIRLPQIMMMFLALSNIQLECNCTQREQISIINSITTSAFLLFSFPIKKQMN